MKTGSPSAFAARSASRRSQRVRRDAAGQDQAAGPVLARRLPEAAHERVHHRALEGGQRSRTRVVDVLGSVGHGSMPSRCTWSSTAVLMPLNEKSRAPVLDAGDRELDGAVVRAAARAGR